MGSDPIFLQKLYEPTNPKIRRAVRRATGGADTLPFKDLSAGGPCGSPGRAS